MISTANFLSHGNSDKPHWRIHFQGGPADGCSIVAPDHFVTRLLCQWHVEEEDVDTFRLYMPGHEMALLHEYQGNDETDFRKSYNEPTITLQYVRTIQISVYADTHDWEEFE